LAGRQGRPFAWEYTVRAAYPKPWQVAQRARAADLDQLLDDIERRLSRLSSALPAVASAPRIDRVTDTIASAFNEIADRFSNRTRVLSKDASRVGGRVAEDARQLGDETLRKLAHEVEQRPLVTLAIAVGVGALAAGLLARR
jgi:ElaB/YqjD/DUF883 family membrane-anchored ribosome-binding protein